MLALPFAVTALGDGVGDPVIVLPGGPCRGPEYLGDFAGVGDVRPLIVLHPRGTPRSGGLSRGWWADASDVILLADALGLSSFDVIAHSAGTRLALATAAQFTSRVGSMALITPPASWLSGTPSDAESIAEDWATAEAREALAAMTTDDPATESEFRVAFRRQAPRATHAGPPSSKLTRRSVPSASHLRRPGSSTFLRMQLTASALRVTHEPWSSRAVATF